MEFTKHGKILSASDEIRAMNFYVFFFLKVFSIKFMNSLMETNQIPNNEEQKK